MRRKDLTKELILQAMANTRTNMAAARYLNCCYSHYKKWSKLYSSEIPGVSLFDKHKNIGGKGVPKFSGNAKKFPIWDIIEGRALSNHYTPNQIKDAMIREGLIREQCCECGFHERRVVDFKMPLLLYFKDNNRRNYKPENCVLMCYNCYFLKIEDIFTPKQELTIQDHKSVTQHEGKVDWELSDYQKEQLDKIIVKSNEVPIKSKGDLDINDLISRK